MLRATLLLIALAAALVLAAAATAKPEATVVSVSYKQGDTFVNVVVAIPKRIDKAARSGKADCSLQVRISYGSASGTLESASGSVPVANTTPAGPVDRRTVAVGLQVQLGTSPPPGSNPGFNASVELVCADHGGEDDDDDDDDDEDDG